MSLFIILFPRISKIKEYMYIAKTSKRILSSNVVAQIFYPQPSSAELEKGFYQASQASNSGGVWFPGVFKQWGPEAMLFPEGFETGRGKSTLAWAGLTVDWHFDIKKYILMSAES